MKPSKYYDNYFTLDILYNFTCYVPTAIFDTYKFLMNA